MLDVRLGAANTIVLLGSSFTMATGGSCRANRQSPRAHLVLDRHDDSRGHILGVKAYEYNQKFVEHVVPSLDWAPEGETLARLAPGGLEHAQIYFFFYFAMTGLHAIHMIIGMGLLLWLVLRARKDDFTPHISRPWKSSACTGTSSISSGFFCFRCST